MTRSPDEFLVGAIALASVGWIVWILVRGMRDGRLPIGKAQILGGERPGAFRLLFGLYIAAALLMAWIGIDLLVGLSG